MPAKKKLERYPVAWVKAAGAAIAHDLGEDVHSAEWAARDVIDYLDEVGAINRRKRGKRVKF